MKYKIINNRAYITIGILCVLTFLSMYGIMYLMVVLNKIFN